MKFVYSFSDITYEALNFAGGKGASLCKMYNNGIMIPQGFVILSTAFENNQLKEKAHSDIKKHLENLPNVTLAVRSSALSEDSAKASFAGEFESVLNVEKHNVFSAIKAVANSAKSQRVREYSKVHGINLNPKIAVIVQTMINSNISGVIFSADPITGSHVNMVGNFVFGAGEQLMSGDKNAYTFTISRLKGKYQGDKYLRPYVKYLYKFTLKAEKIFGCKLDIEWVIENKKLYIVQARPITTLQTINYDTYEINESNDTDALWSSNNVGEALPNVMSPFTWSLLREMDL